jgi:hypothetical protein
MFGSFTIREEIFREGAKPPPLLNSPFPSISTKGRGQGIGFQIIPLD